MILTVRPRHCDSGRRFHIDEGDEGDNPIGQFVHGTFARQLEYRMVKALTEREPAMKLKNFLLVSLLALIAAGMITACTTSTKPAATYPTEPIAAGRVMEDTMPPPPPPPPPSVARTAKLSPAPSVMPPPGYPHYRGGETYADINERPFVNATEEPLSTFSLHADSAAYANVRRFLEQGQWPPFDAVRIEELINYFSYDYPEPDGNHPFSVSVETGSCPWAEGHVLAKIGIKGRDIPRDKRPPANLVFLIDTSGSMNQPNRLPLVQESLKALLKMLNPDDRVAIVTYAGSSKIALESTSVEEQDKIKSAIDTLNATGSTHGSAGIQDAYAVAEENLINKGINRVILATDGDFNVGVTNLDGLGALIEEKRGTGIFLTVLGYGMGNLKEETLSMLASKGNGNYAYINDYSEARRVLVEQVTGTLLTIAKDVKAQVEFNPAQVRSYRLLGYETRMLAARDFNDDAKDAGEIGANHTVTALYQIVPKGAPLEPGVDALRYQSEEEQPEPQGNATELMFVKLRYKLPDKDDSELIEVPVEAETAAIKDTTDDFRFAASAAGFGLLLRNSVHKGTATFDDMLDLADAALANDHKREELLDLIVKAKTLLQK